MDVDIVKKVNKYIKAVKHSIQLKYKGEIPAEFIAQLDQLEDLYTTYLRARKNFQEQDVLTPFGNRLGVNQNFALMIQITSTMDKLVKNFGISPLAASKIKDLQPGGDEEKNFLETL